jgi:hypothetical protein
MDMIWSILAVMYCLANAHIYGAGGAKHATTTVMTLHFCTWRRAATYTGARALVDS